MTAPRSLDELLESAGIESRLISRLACFGTLVLEANRRFNLTGAKDTVELVAHLIDSLSVAPFARDRLVDVGSGAGFPAIPVAIATGVGLTLIEASQRKARFLQHAIETLGLDGTVVAQRAEAAAHDQSLRERFASATARAVSSAPTVAELLLPLLASGGTAILQRGQIEARERAALDDASLMLGGRVEAEHAIGGDRRIILIRKTSPTPARFPRRTGVPAKRPLCM